MTGPSRWEAGQHIPDPVDCYTMIDEGHLAGRGVTQLTIVVILYTIRDGWSDRKTVLRRRMPYCVWCRLMASFPSGASACGGLTHAVVVSSGQDGIASASHHLTISLPTEYTLRAPMEYYLQVHMYFSDEWDVDTPRNDGPTRSSSLEEQRDEAHRPAWIVMDSWQEDGLPLGLLLGAHRTVPHGDYSRRRPFQSANRCDASRSPARAEP